MAIELRVEMAKGSYHSQQLQPGNVIIAFRSTERETVIRLVSGYTKIGALVNAVCRRSNAVLHCLSHNKACPLWVRQC